MHELSVCLALLEQVDRIAREQSITTVSKIVIKLGPLSGVEPELLRRAYPLAAAGTVAERAELEIEPSDIVVHCSQCGSDSAATANRLLCSTCGDYRTQIVSGDELILQRVELTPGERKPIPARAG
ncbi:MAG: hydrogenase maturation nickel metallochaperone HypA [Woeseiaceae bacterium]|nr:hydrogenase maturation nickel metallochaperone HypA [Woeseiaceae bacterium]